MLTETAICRVPLNVAICLQQMEVYFKDHQFNFLPAPSIIYRKCKYQVQLHKLPRDKVYKRRGSH